MKFNFDTYTDGDLREVFLYPLRNKYSPEMQHAAWCELLRRDPVYYTRPTHGSGLGQMEITGWDCDRGWVQLLDEFGQAWWFSG